MLQLSKLNLQFAFVAFCPEGKNIQDQGDPIHHPQVELPFEVALLCRAERLVKQDNVRLVRLREQNALFEFTRANEIGSVRSGSSAGKNRHHLGTRPFGKHDKLVCMSLVIG